MTSNQLVVAQGDHHPALFSHALTAKQLHWLVNPKHLSSKLTVDAQIRHRQPLQKAAIQWHQNQLHAQFECQQRAITPGQSIAMYIDGICIGSAIIDKAIT